MGFGIDFVLDGIEGFSSAVGNLQAAQGTIGNDFAHWMGDQAQDFGDWADAALPGPDVYGNIADVTEGIYDWSGNLYEMHSDIQAAVNELAGNTVALGLGELGSLGSLGGHDAEALSLILRNAADGKPWDAGLDGVADKIDGDFSDMKDGFWSYLRESEADINKDFPLFDDKLNRHLEQDLGIPGFADRMPHNLRDAVDDMRSDLGLNFLGGASGIGGGGATGSVARGAWQGMDVEAVQAAARQLQEMAQRTTRLIGKVDGEVSDLGASWNGVDSERYVQQWQGQYKAVLTRSAKLLEQMSQDALEQVATQKQASGR